MNLTLWPMFAATAVRSAQQFDQAAQLSASHLIPQNHVNSILHTLLAGLNRSYRCENLKINCAFSICQDVPSMLLSFYHGNQIHLLTQMAALNLSVRS
jgi:hypothetical protein